MTTTNHGIETVTSEQFDAIIGTVEVYSRQFCDEGFLVYGYVASSTACGGKKHVGYLVLVDWAARRASMMHPSDITALRALDSMA